MMYLGDQAVGISKMTNCQQMTLDTSDRRESYPSTSINSIVSFTNSTLSYSFVNIVSVQVGKVYLIAVTNGSTVSSSNDRDMVIIDENMTVKEVYTLSISAGQTNYVGFKPTNTGSLILCVDKKYKDLKIYELTID